LSASLGTLALSRKGNLLRRRSCLGTDLQFLNHKTQLISTLGTVATVPLYDLTRRFQFKPGVEEVAALGAYYSLRRQIVAKTPDDERKFSRPVLKQFQKTSEDEPQESRAYYWGISRVTQIEHWTYEDCSSWV